MTRRACRCEQPRSRAPADSEFSSESESVRLASSESESVRPGGPPGQARAAARRGPGFTGLHGGPAKPGWLLPKGLGDS